MREDKIVDELKKQAQNHHKKHGSSDADALKYERQSKYLRRLKR